MLQIDSKYLAIVVFTRTTYFTFRVSFRKLSKGDATGGIWILRGAGRIMLVKDATKFHKRHLWGGAWWGLAECVCVQQDFIQDFEFWKGGGGNPKFGVDVDGVYST